MKSKLPLTLTILTSLVVGLLTSFLLVVVTPVYAIDNPGSGNITIESVRLFQNLWETDDKLAVIEYRLMYDPIPDEDSEDTYLVATANMSEIFFSRPVDYYAHNFTSVYMEASDNFTWGDAYSVKLMGNPSYFDPITEGLNMKTQELSGGHWVSGDEDTSRAYLGVWSVSIAETLEASWGITLLTSGGRLNSVGALKFKEAIPGLDSIVPDIFAVSQSYPTSENLTTVSTYEDLLKTRTGERLEGALDNLGTFLHVPGALIGGVGLFVLFFILAGRIFTATGSVSTSIVCAIPFILAGNMVGVLSLSITFVAGLMVIVLFGVVFILGRMG